MILLALYAVFVFYLAMRYRRRWGGFVSVALGVLVLLAISRPAMREDNVVAALLPPDLRMGYRHLLILLLPEAGLVGLVGFFIASLPRAESPTACRGCRYELAGLNPAGLVCPECGAAWKGPGSGLEEPPVTLTPIPRGGGRTEGRGPRGEKISEVQGVSRGRDAKRRR